MLRIKNISKTFNNKIILNDISLDVPPGKVAFLLGESGVGKSTLLRILNNLEAYDNGTITLDGKVLYKTNIHKLVGLVFQHFNLFPHLTVEQNITLALEKVCQKSPEEAHNIAQELLKKYKLEGKSTSLINNISGGQKQRLAIARALALNPSVICFDEPTSALDPLLTGYVAKQIQQLASENKIVLVGTHDMDFVLNENIQGIIYLMHQGKIIETASTQEFKKNPESFKQITHFINGNDNS